MHTAQLSNYSSRQVGQNSTNHGTLTLNAVRIDYQMYHYQNIILIENMFQKILEIKILEMSILEMKIWVK